MCRRFKNTLASLFHLYLPVLVCLRVTYDEKSMYKGVKINIFKKNTFENSRDNVLASFDSFFLLYVTLKWCVS